MATAADDPYRVSSDDGAGSTAGGADAMTGGGGSSAPTGTGTEDGGGTGHGNTPTAPDVLGTHGIDVMVPYEASTTAPPKQIHVLTDSACAPVDEEVMAAPTGVSTLSAADFEGPSRWTVRTSTVIMVAMIISCSASICGGLIMYQEALQSLEQTVEENSASELAAVKTDITRSVEEVIVLADAMKNLMYSTSLIRSDDKAAWAELTRLYVYSAIKANPALYSIGVVLIPHDGNAVEEYVYNMLWFEREADATGEYVFATYPDHGDEKQPLLAPGDKVFGGDTTARDDFTAAAYRVNVSNGGVEEKLYEYRAAYYVRLLPNDWDPKNGSTLADLVASTDDGWAPAAYPKNPRGFQDGIAYRPRGVNAWYSGIGAVHTYAGVDIVYRPPPPPHPWSKYRAINFPALYFHVPWANVVQQYAQLNPQTMIAVVNPQEEFIYVMSGSTAIVVDEGCMANYSNLTVGDVQVLGTCSIRVANAAPVVRDAFHTLMQSGDDEFVIATAGGEKHFLRKLGVLPDAMLLWMRPTSAVQAKVNESLLLFLVFAFIVVICDGVLAAVELFLVAAPMVKVSDAINSIGRMDLRTAESDICAIRKPFMLSEVSTVVAGATWTIKNLQEYSAYLPEALMADRGGAAPPPPAGHVSFALCDVIGAADLWETVPADMADALKTYNALLRNMILKHHGFEVKQCSGTFLVAFRRAADAAQFALESQESLIAQAWPTSLNVFQHARKVVENGVTVYNGLRMRCALHTGPGEPVVNADTQRVEYETDAVRVAAEVLREAVDGMTVVTGAFVHALKSENAKMQAPLIRLPAWLLENCSGVNTHAAGLGGVGGADSEAGKLQLFYAVPKTLMNRRTSFHALLKARRHARQTEAGRRGLRFISNRTLTDAVPHPPPSPSSPRRAMSMSQRLSEHAGDIGHLDRQLIRSHGAVVVLNLERVRTLDLAPPEDSHVLLAIANGSIQMASDVGYMTDARIESVHGSMLVMSWGLSSVVSEPALQCLRFMGLVMRRKMTVVMGGVAGPLLHGNVGTLQRRYHNVFGLGCHYARMLVKRCVSAESEAMFIAKGGVPPTAADACTPVEVIEAEQDYAPYVVVERVCPFTSSQLRPSWGPIEAEEVIPWSAHGRRGLREAVLATMTAGAPHAFTFRASAECIDEVRDAASVFAQRADAGLFVTPASSLAAAPTREISNAQINQQLGLRHIQRTGAKSRLDFELDLTAPTPISDAPAVFPPLPQAPPADPSLLSPNYTAAASSSMR